MNAQMKITQKHPGMAAELLRASSAAAGIAAIGDIIFNAQVAGEYEGVNQHLEGLGLALRTLGGTLENTLGELSIDAENLVHDLAKGGEQ